MPQEYSTRTPGSPAPSPSSFGSEPMKLDQPNFVAQTNVAKEPDVFGALQEILGLGAKVGIQAQEMKTQAIKDNISVENAKQAGIDRMEANARQAEVRDDRAAAKLRVAGQAKRFLAIQMETDPAKQAILRAAFEKEATDAVASGDPETAIDALQATQQSEVTQSQTEEAARAIANAAAVKISYDASGPINTYERSRDEEGLLGIMRSAQDRAADPALPIEVRAANTKVATDAAQALNSLESDKAKDAADLEKRERALQFATKTAVVSAGKDHVLSMMANTYRMSVDLANVPDESVRKALFDDLVERVSKADPAMAERFASADPIEAKAASEALYDLVEPLAIGISRERNAYAEKERVSIITDAALSIATGGTPESLNAAISSVEYESQHLTPVQIDKIHKSIGKSYIDGFVGRSPSAPGPAAVAAMNTVLLDNTLPPVLRVAANDATKAVIAQIGNMWAVRRTLPQDDGTPAEVDLTGKVTKAAVPPSNYGYANMAKDPEEFLAKFTMESYGLTPADIVKDDNLSSILQPQMTAMFNAYIADANRRDSAQGKSRAAADRLTKAGRARVSVNDAFPDSVLGRAIADRTYIEMSSSEMSAALTDALDGFRDQDIPTVLKKLLEEGSGDIHNHRLINEFWKLHKPGANGKLDTMLLTDPGMRVSRANGLFMSYLESMPDIGEQKRAEILKKYNNNIVASMGGPSLTATERDSVAVQEKLEMDSYVEKLSSGAGLETRMFVPDPWNHSASEAYATLDASDRETLVIIAQMASAAPAQYRDGLVGSMMQKQGYGMYQMADGSYDLLNTSQGRSRSVDMDGQPVPGTTGLPGPAVVASSRYQEFLQSLVPEINKALAKRKDFNGYTLDAFKDGDHHSVGISPSDSDLRDGVCGLYVLNGAGKRVEVDLSEVAITTDHWIGWQRANPVYTRPSTLLTIP